jgi:argininosuccinate lyase
MPHKRNPDLAELVRAESGTATGRLTAVLGILKGLPMGYQRDLQATKPVLFEAVERTTLALQVLAPMAHGATYRPDPPRPGRSTASVELADALVAQGVPFRTAHGRVAEFIAERELAGGGLADAGRTELRRSFPELGKLGFEVPKIEDEPELRGSSGGSSYREVAILLQEVGRRTRASRSSVRRERTRLVRLRRAFGIPDGWAFLIGAKSSAIR